MKIFNASPGLGGPLTEEKVKRGKMQMIDLWYKVCEYKLLMSNVELN